MLIIGSYMECGSITTSTDFVQGVSSSCQVKDDWEELLDWTVIPKQGKESGPAKLVQDKYGYLMYTRSATAMIRGLKKLNSLDQKYKVYSGGNSCLGMLWGGWKGYSSRTKVGGSLAVIKHNVKQAAIRGGVRFVGTIAFKANRNWGKRFVRSVNEASLIDHYQSLSSVETSNVPFPTGFFVFVLPSQHVPQKAACGGGMKTMSASVTFGEIASQLENGKCELAKMYDGSK